MNIEYSGPDEQDQKEPPVMERDLKHEMQKTGYVLQSNLFDFETLMNTDNYGIKKNKTSLYKG